MENVKKLECLKMVKKILYFEKSERKKLDNLEEKIRNAKKYFFKNKKITYHFQEPSNNN